MDIEALLDCLPCGVVSFDDNGAIRYANGTILSLLGFEWPELESKPVEGLLTVAGRIFFQTHLYPLVRLHGRASEMFVLMRHKNGTNVGVLLNATQREVRGQPVIDCAVMEVVERRKFEDALLRAKQAAESANEALIARSDELEEANRVLEEQALELELQHQQLEEQATELEVGSEELAHANDVLQTHTEDLERARQAAEEANRAKSQFLAVMSHELRTPLNAIGGYVQLIELGIHGEVTEAQHEALSRIVRAQRHLLRLINDVLNLARIEAGRVEYVRENVAIDDLIDNVLPMVQPQMEAASLTSRNSIPPQLVALADREKLQQIVINVLSNAVKFTPAGGVIRIEGRPDVARREIVIEVTDSGIGIPPEKLASIFEPFVQVDTTHTRKREGSGLGLAISRDLARGMGGDLTARSEEGKGSIFTLTVPSA